MPRNPDCRVEHLAIVAGVCPWCHRTIQDGHVVWQLAPKSIVRAVKPAPYATLLPFSLWEDPGYLHRIGETFPNSYRVAMVSLEANTVLHRGAKLETWEAKRVEEIIRDFGGDTWLRGLLAGYYLLHDEASADRASALKHVLGLIETAGETYVAVKAARLCISRQVSDEWLKWCHALEGVVLNVITDLTGNLLHEYLDPIKEAWNLAVAARPADTRVIGRAAEFFMAFDRVTSGRLMRDARKLEPDRPRWTEALAGLYQLEFQARRDESRPDWAAMALAKWEQALSQCTDARHGCHILCNAATCAFEAHEHEKARSFAQKLVDEPDDSWTVEQARYMGHQLLGRLDLENGDVERAKAHLFASIALAKLWYSRVVGPRVKLAKELLDRGESEAVASYFKICAKLFGKEHPEYGRWVEELERGHTPDLHGRE